MVLKIFTILLNEGSIGYKYNTSLQKFKNFCYIYPNKIRKTDNQT